MRSANCENQDIAQKHKPKLDPKRPPRMVDIVAPTYQPSKEELEEDVRVDASFEEAVDALAQPVKINYIPRPKARR